MLHQLIKFTFRRLSIGPSSRAPNLFVLLSLICSSDNVQRVSSSQLENWANGHRRCPGILDQPHHQAIAIPSTSLPLFDKPGRGLQGGCGRVFVVDVPVLAAGSALKPMMLTAIHSNLPHIVMQFGTDLDCPNCPSICCAVDLCAALTTGNFHFFASLAKHFLHCLAKVYAPQDYAPIILSGV